MSTGLHSVAPAEVSIILPVFNDSEWIAQTIQSCREQTLANVEIIVVDDASTDDTTRIVEEIQKADPRVHLIRQETNRSAFQARRRGVQFATAPFVLFLDGDDELVPHAAATALKEAHDRSADVVAFGSHVVKPDGSTGGEFESSMQPQHSELVGDDIMPSLFPVGKLAQGQLWRYLFATDLLRAAYTSLPTDLELRRANDIPIAFLALMHANRYVSTSARLYRYFFRRGASGHRITTQADFDFLAAAIDSIESIRTAVHEQAKSQGSGETLLAAYESARRTVIGSVMNYVRVIADEHLRVSCVHALAERVGRFDLIAACAEFNPKSLAVLATTATVPALGTREPRHVVLRATNLSTGGAQGVVVAQAQHLARAGVQVTIIVDAALDTHFELPEGVGAVRIVGTFAEKLEQFISYCREYAVDVVIDHYVFYNDRWPFYAMAAASEGISTVGWLHNFALRPILDGSTRASFLDSYLGLLGWVVVLSEADVAYWKLRGIDRVSYLPNPPSPLLKGLAPQAGRPAPRGPIELVWWGRLQQATKQVRELVEVGALLNELDVDFRLTVIGPDSPDLKAAQLHQMAEAKGVGDRLVTVGSLHGQALINAVEHAHIFVSTSIIEGYPLVLVEAQALGLPLAMYDLPWLATLRDNEGAITVPQGDRAALAIAIAQIARDPASFERLSRSALSSAATALSHDFDSLYLDLVRGTLAPEHSPEPTPRVMRLLLDENIRFAERHSQKERRALEKARAEVAAQKKSTQQARSALRQAQHSLEEILVTRIKPGDAARATPPSVAQRGIKGWLQRFVPTSMKQSAFYARHQHTIMARRHRQLVSNQGAIEARLKRLEASLVVSRESPPRPTRDR